MDGGAISARGKLEAAKAQVQTQLAAMRTRGAVEEFIPNPETLEDGKVPLHTRHKAARATWVPPVKSGHGIRLSLRVRDSI